MLVDRQSDGSERHILIRPSSDSAPRGVCHLVICRGQRGEKQRENNPWWVGFFGGVVERLGFVLSGGQKRERSPVVWPWAETPHHSHRTRVIRPHTKPPHFPAAGRRRQIRPAQLLDGTLAVRASHRACCRRVFMQIFNPSPTRRSWLRSRAGTGRCCIGAGWLAEVHLPIRKWLS